MRRAGFLSLHRWLALALAPFLVLQVLTGTVLVVQELTLPAPAAAPRAVSDYAGSAAAAVPGFRVTRLYLPGLTSRDAFAELAGPDGQTAYASLDPQTAAVRRVGPLAAFPLRAAVQLHYHLASGTGGLIAIALVGLALVSAACTGFVVWWPGRKNLRQAMKVRPGLPPRLRRRQLHRTVGASVAALALFSGVTGLLLVVPDLYAALQPAAPSATVPPAPTPAAVDRAVAAAQGRFPDALLRDVRFPPADRVAINFAAPERNARAVHSAAVRISDGAVIDAVPAATSPVLWMKVLHLHTGQAVPVLGPLLLLAEAAALLFLAWAGTAMWFTARRDRARSKAR